MTKLEEKLIELGYEYASPNGYFCRLKAEWVMRYEKDTEQDYRLVIDLDSNRNTIIDYFISLTLLRPKDFDNFSESLNQLQQDLEVLKDVSK